MISVLVATGIDEMEDLLGLDMTLMFGRLGLGVGRDIEFYAVQDSAGMDSGLVRRGGVHRGYMELDRVVTSREPVVLIALHHALVQWHCYEIQLFSDVCTKSSRFRSWAEAVPGAQVTLGRYQAGEHEMHRRQFPSAGRRLFHEMDFLMIEVIPALRPLEDRLRITDAPLRAFDFPGGDVYEKELRELAHVLAGVHDHHPWLAASPRL